MRPGRAYLSVGCSAKGNQPSTCRHEIRQRWRRLTPTLDERLIRLARTRCVAFGEQEVAEQYVCAVPLLLCLRAE
jgi:hypothetical protein